MRFAALPLALFALPLAAQPALERTPASLTTLGSTTPSGPSRPLAITPNGRYVLLVGDAPNFTALQSGPTCGQDLFVLDTQTSTSQLITHEDAAPGRCIGGMFAGSISDDGRFVAFNSGSPRLLPLGVDTNLTTDVFVYDRQTASLELITQPVGGGGVPTSQGGGNELLTPDGRYVLFASTATDLVAGVTDGSNTLDVFRRDRQTGVTTLVSRTAGSPTTAANGDSRPLAVTPDGRFVLALSRASDLVPGYTGPANFDQLYRLDLQTGTAVLVSAVAGSPTTGSGGFHLGGLPRLSADGRFVTFVSDGADLVAGQSDPGQTLDVFLADLQTGTTTLVSHAAGSPTTAADFPSELGAVTPDGRWVAFESLADNIVSGFVDAGLDDRNSYLFDRVTGTTVLVSRQPGAPTTGAGLSEVLAVTPDGQTVLHVQDGQHFLFDLASGVNRLVTHTPAGASTPSGDRAGTAVMTPTASVVVFASPAVDLVTASGDTNGLNDLFRFQASTGAVDLLTFAGQPLAGPVTGGGFSLAVAVTPDGRFGLFDSAAPNLVEGDDNGATDVFVADGHTGTRRLISFSTAIEGATAAGDSQAAAITPDGRYVLVSTTADDFSFATGPSGFRQVYRRRVPFTADDLVSHVAGAPGVRANGDSRAVAISNDGRFVLFWSRATNLVAGFTDSNDAAEELYLHDIETRTTQLVSHAAGAPATTADGGSSLANELAFETRLSPDGTYVLFSTRGTNLAAGVSDTNGRFDLYRYDRVTGLNTPIAVTAASPTTLSTGGARGGGLSSNGRFVVFQSDGTDLVTGVIDTNLAADVFVRDLQLGTTELISHRGGSPGTTANRSTVATALTPDGRHVLLVSSATDLLNPPGAAPPSGVQNVFVYDRTSGTMELISRSAGDPTLGANRDSLPLALSPSGHAVLFESFANDLPAHPGVTSGTGRNLFLVNRRSGQMTLVSALPGAVAAAAAGSSAPLAALANHGNLVWFYSNNRELVPNDTNGRTDTFFASTELFADGFETGGLARWSVVVP